MTGTTPLDYGPWREATLGRVTERLERRVILGLIGDRLRCDVLDVGCGGRAQASAAPFAVVAADALRLPFEGGSFDLVSRSQRCVWSTPRRRRSGRSRES